MNKKKKILITGGAGFLGRACASKFSNNNIVYGIGHGEISSNDLLDLGITKWINSSIDLESLIELEIKPDVIIHCAGGSSVGKSVEDPYQDYTKTVSSTASVLEFVRISCPEAKIIYTSSPAVQGVHDNTPIKTSDPCLPVSPYGYHKKMSEDLCESYKRQYDLDVNIIRFFSIYGEGLRKQLLWDALNKISNDKAVFWGTGNETRDWIYISDAVDLVYQLANTTERQLILNCGSGISTTIKETLELLKSEMNVDTKISFNQESRPGDPLYYWANIDKAKSLGWRPKVTLREGLKKIVSWYNEENH